MTQARHTPGPWHISHKAEEEQNFPILSYSGKPIAVAREKDDAQLIAAAPDLLAAAEALWNSADELDCATNPSEWHALCKAIAKAKGE